MKEIASLDLVATSYINTHSFHGAIPALGSALDYLWDDMDVEIRDFVVKALVERAKEFHPLTVQDIFVNEGHLSNHNLVYGAPGMAITSLGLFHHVPEAEGWLLSLIHI